MFLETFSRTNLKSSRTKTTYCLWRRRQKPVLTLREFLKQSVRNEMNNKKTSSIFIYNPLTIIDLARKLSMLEPADTDGGQSLPIDSDKNKRNCCM